MLAKHAAALVYCCKVMSQAPSPVHVQFATDFPTLTATAVSAMDVTPPASTKLAVVGARAHSGALGKFISVAPILDPKNPLQSIGYGYTGTNPIAFADPSGLRDEGVGCGGCHAGMRIYVPHHSVNIL